MNPSPFSLWSLFCRYSDPSSFSPSPSDWQTLRSELLAPTVSKFLKSNHHLALDDCIHALIAATSDPDSPSPRPHSTLAYFFHKCTQNPAIAGLPPESREKQARSYLIRCIENKLVELFATPSASSTIRKRVRETIQAETKTASWQLHSSFFISLPSAPYAPPISQEALPALVARIGLLSPSGHSKDFPAPLPTHTQIRDAVNAAISSPPASIHQDTLCELCIRLFSISEAPPFVSINAPNAPQNPTSDSDASPSLSHEDSQEDSQEDSDVESDEDSLDLPPPEASSSLPPDSEDDAPTEEENSLPLPASEDPDLLSLANAAPFLVTACEKLLDSLDAAAHKDQPTSFHHHFRALWLWENTQETKLTTRSYSNRSKVSDATLTSRKQKFCDHIRQIIKQNDATYEDVIHATARLQSKHQIFFRNFWGFDPSTLL